MVKGRTRKENGNFCHEPETSTSDHDGARASSPVPPSCAPTNQAHDRRRDDALRRKTEGVASMTQAEAHATLATSIAHCKREVRSKCDTR